MNEVALRTTTAPQIDDLLFDADSLLPVPEGFVVDNLEKANWASSKFLSAQRRIEDRTNLAKTYKAKIDLWLENANRADIETQSTMVTLLEPFTRDYLKDLKNRKSFKVLGAVIGMRKMPDTLDISDENEAIGFCLEHYPDIVVTKQSISKTLAKQYLGDGAKIPGLSLSQGGEELVIKEA